MRVKEIFDVREIDKGIAKPWILKKHYAERMPSVSYSFGLFGNNTLVGVCTFGYPPNYEFNNGKCIFENYEVITLELNRLVTDDGLPKNALSFFVSKCLDELPKPSCVVAYADPNKGHKGYIYQATNWFYTGTSTPKHRYHFEDGTTFDIRRGIDKKEKEHGKIVKKEKIKPTHRYFYFNGHKLEKEKMKKELKYDIKEYPKGQNEKNKEDVRMDRQKDIFNYYGGEDD